MFPIGASVTVVDPLHAFHGRSGTIKSGRLVGRTVVYAVAIGRINLRCRHEHLREVL
jgi:hypothetical protein